MTALANLHPNPLSGFSEDEPDTCPGCGEEWDGPNVEAFELSGFALCDDCAEAIFQDNGQFGVGA